MMEGVYAHFAVRQYDGRQWDYNPHLTMGDHSNMGDHNNTGEHHGMDN